jgi:hypothetical protein
MADLSLTAATAMPTVTPRTDWDTRRQVAVTVLLE